MGPLNHFLMRGLNEWLDEFLNVEMRPSDQNNNTFVEERMLSLKFMLGTQIF